MNINTDEEFAALLNSETIENLTINIRIDSLTVIEDSLSKYIYFKNCILNFHQLIFLNIRKPGFFITFEHCEINGHLEFQACELKGLHFINLRKINSILVIGVSQQKAKLNYLTWTDGLTDYPQYILSG